MNTQNFIFLTVSEVECYKSGLLAQLVERGADNAKVMSSSLIQTIFGSEKITFDVTIK